MRGLMRVLRLEMEDGSGIYRNAQRSVWNRATKDFEDESLHVLPHRDPKLRFDDICDRDYIFGFESIEQYHRWVFNPYWRRELGRLGAVLSFYEVDERHVRKGLERLIFVKEKAKRVESVSPFFYK